MAISNGTQEAALRSVQEYFARLDWNGAEMHLVGSEAVASFEAKLREHYGMRHAVCVSNATTGLLAIALALDFKNIEFISTGYTYGASVAGWLLLGNRPVFADIDAETLTLEPKSARLVATRKTRALLGVDIYGNPSDSTGLRKLADEFGLWYIADAAQSLGARREGLPASCFADALVVSFTVGKPLFAGEGGAILTNNDGLYEKIVWFTQHPYRQKRDLGLTLSNEFGLNARIHPLAAIWANAVFEKSIEAVQIHQEGCFEIIKVLNSTGLTDSIDFQDKRIRPSFFRLTAAWRKRPRALELQAELARHGHSLAVGAAPVRLIYRQPAFLAQFQGLCRIPERCLEAERQARRRFCLEGIHAGGQDQPRGFLRLEAENFPEGRFEVLSPVSTF